MREGTKLKVNYKSDTSKKFRFVFTTTDDNQLCHQLQYNPAFANICNYKNAIVKQNKQNRNNILLMDRSQKCSEISKKIFERL